MKAVILILLSAAISAGATTIRHMSFEEMCAKSDLVAEAEVVTAGGIFARYRIIKSYKGPEKGEFTIKTPPGPHGPFFPLDLVGERLFILAAKTDLTQMNSTSSSGLNVMAWRQIPHDYEFPLWQGKLSIKDDAEAMKLAGRAKSFLAKSKESQGIYFLKEQCAKLGKIDSFRGRYTINVRRFILAKTNKGIIEAYNNLTDEERYNTNLGRGGKMADEEVIGAHRQLYGGVKPNRFDKMPFLSEEEFIKEWKALKEESRKNNKEQYESMVACETQAGYLTDPKKWIPARDKSTKELLNEFESAKLWVLSDIMAELRKRKVKLTEKQLESVYVRAIDAMSIREIYGLYELVRLRVPERKEEFVMQLKEVKPIKYNESRKLGLMAFLGDKKSQKKVIEKLKKEEYDSVSFIFHCLYRFNRKECLTFKSHKKYKLDLAEFLIEEDAVKNEKLIVVILDSVEPDRLNNPVNRLYSSNNKKLFEKYYGMQKLDERMEDAFDALDQNSSRPNEKIISEIKNYKGSDQRILAMGAFYLAYCKDFYLLDFLKKHSKALNGNKFIKSLPRVLCSKLDKEGLQKVLDSGDKRFRIMALNYLVIKDEQNSKDLKEFLESEDLQERLHAAVNLAERGDADAVDILLNSDFSKINTETREGSIFATVCSGRLSVLFSNMSKGKTNGMSVDELKEYWQANRKSFRDPWRSILDKAGYE